MRFRYKVINEKMALAEGTLEAVDLEAARRMITENSWQLISIKEKGTMANALNNTSYQGKVKYESIAAFCSQMAMMIHSGANFVRGIDILQAQMEDKRLKSALSIIQRGVSRGDSLSASMRDTKALPELLVNLVAVGEESGNLDSVLVSMAEYYERENFIRKKVSSAAVYPVILTFVLVGLIIFFLKFMLPELMGLMTGSGQSLPLVTQVIVDASNFLDRNGIYLLVGIVLFSFLMHRVFSILKYRYYLDALLLRMPVVGRNMKNVVISRFSRTLALFLHSSLPIVPILNSMENIVGNQVPCRAVARARERIINGETLAQAFGQEKFFDPLVIQMIAIGEETGKLEELMSEVANHYDKRVEVGIAKMVALVEPIFTLIIGIFAGVIIIAIALPIFSMATTVK